MIRTSNLARAFCLLLALHPLVAWAEPAAPDITLTGQQSPALAITFSLDGTLLAGVADDGVLKIWNLDTRKEVFSFSGLRANHNEVRFLPDGKRIVAIGSNSDVALFDLKTGAAQKSITLTDLPGGPTALDLSPDGKTIAVVGRGAMRLYDASTGASRKQVVVHPDHGVSGVAYSRKGDLIATVGSDHVAAVVEVSSGKVVRQFDLELPGEAVAFSQDGKSLITYAERVIRKFDIDSGKMQKLVDKGYPFRTMALTPDGKSIILGGAGRGPWLVSLGDGTISDDAYVAEDRINCAAMSPDGRFIAGGGNEGPVYVWKLSHQ